MGNFGKCAAEIVDRSSEYHRLTDGTHRYLTKSSAREMDVLKNTNRSLLGIRRSAVVTAGSGQDCLRKCEYFGNVA